MIGAARRTWIRPTLAVLACAIVLPPALFMLGLILLHETVPASPPVLYFWMSWAVAGCVAGIATAVYLCTRTRWWPLLAIPALVDGYIAFGIPFIISMGRMH